MRKYCEIKTRRSRNKPEIFQFALLFTCWLDYQSHNAFRILKVSAAFVQEVNYRTPALGKIGIRQVSKVVVKREVINTIYNRLNFILMRYIYILRLLSSW